MRGHASTIRRHMAWYSLLLVMSIQTILKPSGKVVDDIQAAKVPRLA